MDLVKHDMIDFDVILIMDWIDSCYALIDRRPHVVKFQFQTELSLSGRGEILLAEVDLFLT